jgi:aminoglycoside phosphotransferase (APT) family kinase protein
MGAQNMPGAEVEVDVALVRALISDQHPDLGDLPIVELANGWDNVIYRLGDDLTVRLPRRELGATLIEHEQRVLPELAGRLPIRIPAPVRVGHPGLGYPWRWSISPWIPGTVAATAPFADSRREAGRLGEFLGALHVTAPDDAPTNSFRGHFIGHNTAIFTERVHTCREHHGFDADAALERWEQLVDVSPHSASGAWIHGDLHALNVLVADGEISGVIDFGDVCSGDPATDLSAAWGLFDTDDAAHVREAAGGDVDDAMWQRAEAWALHFALIYLAHSADNPTMELMGERIMTRLGLW